jgi:hypothetical protein
MKMINVLTRLAELDSNNPNVVTPNSAKPSSSLKECGSMSGMMQPQIPASLTINATAASGSEVSGMLMDIMKLAGVHKVDQSELGIEKEPVTMTMEPVISASTEIHGEPEMGDMVGMIDRMNDDEEFEEETDEGMYGNSPNENVEGYKAFQDHGDLAKNPAMGGDVPKDHEHRSRVRNQPTATMEDMESQLFAEYRQFVSEGKVAEKFDMKPTKPSKKGMFKGKTKEQLEKQLAVLKKSGPHKKDSPEYTKMKELQFAIRAKKKTDKWGKVSEGMEYDESTEIEEVGTSGFGNSGTKKLVKRLGNPGDTYTAKVYWGPEWQEYEVHFYKNDKHMGEGPLYFTSDKDDAISTAEHAIDSYNNKEKSENYMVNDEADESHEASKLDGSAALLSAELKRLAGIPKK